MLINLLTCLSTLSISPSQSLLNPSSLLVLHADTFPLKYLAVMLSQGYATGNFQYSAILSTLLDRAAWTHMLQQSPRGEVMTGGRSSQHQVRRLLRGL